MPEPGGAEAPAARSSRSPQRRTQRTIEVPPAQADPPRRDDAEDHAEEPVGAPTRSAPASRAGTTRKNRRASVPSWDEIILGARRD